MSLNLLAQNSLFYLNHLEWEILLKKISIYLYFESSHEQLLQPLKAKSLNEIDAQHQSLAFFIQKIQDDEDSSLYSPILELDPGQKMFSLPKMLMKGRILDLRELHELAKYIECYEKIFHHLSLWSMHDSFSITGDIIHQIRKNFVQKLRLFVDSDGQVDFLKHPILKIYFEELLQIESSIRNTLKFLCQEPKYSSSLQFSEYDIIHDHYVLAVRSDSYQSSFGQIVTRSESGLTLYVEPFEIKDRCNKRLSILAKIDEITGKICQEFCDFLFPYHKTFANLRELFECIDLYLSKAKFCNENNLVRPSLTHQPEIYLQEMYHPLITNPVKNDLTLGMDQKGLILSGPNTGGKTAALKTIALSQLFLHFGLYLPATYSKIHPFSGVFYFGNDQQSLPEGLSSFSAEVKNYLELFKNLTETNLIIIDEIFNSTSSEEASALALGLFEEIHNFSSAKIIVSTHHQMLKIFMHSQANYLSSHVGFDLSTQRPTYKIIEGMPGSSMALSIFNLLSQKFGFGQNVTSKAQKILDQKTFHYETLLQEVSQKNVHFDKLIQENKFLQRDLQFQQKSQEGLLKLRMEKLFSEFKEKIFSYFSEAESLLETIKKGTIDSPKTLIGQIAKIKSQVRSEEEKIFVTNQSESSNSYNRIPETIEVGKSYFSTILNTIVEVKSLNSKKEEVVVKNGSFTLKLPVNCLRDAGKKNSKPKKTSFHFSLERSDEDLKFQLDCRGVRLEEFERMVLLSLNDLFSGQIPYLLVIHGHGSGVLKNWLRKYLKQHPEFSWESPKEYADGATKISIQ